MSRQRAKITERLNEAGRAVLGCCLHERGAEAARLAVARLRRTDFLSDAARVTFDAVKELVARGEQVDLETVFLELQAAGKAEAAGGSSALAALYEAIPSPEGMETHLRYLAEASAHLEIFDWATQLPGRIADNGADASVLLGDLRRDLDAFGTPSKGDGPVVLSLADVTPEPVRWLWPGRIARGKLTLIIGDPDRGKSAMTTDLAARVTTGAPWPDGGTPAPRGDVVILTAEDGLGDTLRPRLDVMGGDAARVCGLTAIRTGGRERGFDLTRDLADLEGVVKERGAVLIVIDPVSAYLGKTDSYRDAEVRGVLEPVAALAARTGVAIVGVMHLTKNAQRQAMYRGQGSLAFVAAARGVFAVAEDREDPSRRLFVPIKLNIARKPPGLAFRLVAGKHERNFEVARVEWDREPVAVTADEALTGPEPPAERSERDGAKAFLLEMLADGPIAADEVKRQANAAGIAEKTLFRAKTELGIKARKTGFKDGWQWHPPTKMVTKIATNESMTTFGESERSSADKQTLGPKMAAPPPFDHLGDHLRHDEIPPERGKPVEL